MKPARPTARRAAVVALTTLGLAAALVAPATADRVDLDHAVTLSNGAEFPLRQFDWSHGWGPTVNIADGALGHGDQARSDAFDGGMETLVDGVGVTSRGGQATRRGQRLTTRAVTLSGIQVSLTWQAIAQSTTVRLLVRLTNPGRNDRQVTVGMRSNLGSDDAARVLTTSNTDGFFDRGDRWLITFDASATNPDPVVTQVFSGIGGPTPRAAYLGTVTGNPADQLVWDLPVRVRDHSTRYLMFFARLDDSNQDAGNAVGDFNRRHLTPKLLAGISPAVRRAIYNWDL